MEEITVLLVLLVKWPWVLVEVVQWRIDLIRGCSRGSRGRKMLTLLPIWRYKGSMGWSLILLPKWLAGCRARRGLGMEVGIWDLVVRRGSRGRRAGWGRLFNVDLLSEV